MPETPLAQDHIGVGISFPFRFSGKSGGVTQSGGRSESNRLQRVREALVQIWGTALGERFFRPDFGSGLREMLFDPMDETLIASVRHAILEAVLRWEPRVQMQSVGIVEIDGTGGRIAAQVEYLIPQEQRSDNMVLPFSLFNEGA